jgi:cytidyltransferase-like protein
MSPERRRFYLKRHKRRNEMLYTNRKELTVLNLQDHADTVSLDTLAEVLMERPANMIYCEDTAGVLCGIISTGDIHRAADAGGSFVKVNKNFTKLNGREYMRARALFWKNENINALPVVDEEDKLLGDYTRWEDHLQAFDFDFGRFAKAFWKTRNRVALVQPGDYVPRKRERMEQWKSYLEAMGCRTEVVDHRKIVEANAANDIVLFVDQDEVRGMHAFYTSILRMLPDMLKLKLTLTCATFEHVSNEMRNNYMDEFLQKIQASGVYLMTIQFAHASTNEYWADFYSQIHAKYAKIGKPPETKLYEEWWENFFGEYYNHAYAEAIVTHEFLSTKKNGEVSLNDVEASWLHVKDGERRTIAQPEEYIRSIYFFGPCFVIGALVEDAHTMESFLQDLLNCDGYKVRVVNCGSWSDEAGLLAKISRTKFRQGDIAVIYDDNKYFEGIPNLNMAECWEREHAPIDWVVDDPRHCNYKANRMMANEIYEFLKEKLQEEPEEPGNEVEPSEHGMVDIYLERYFSDFHVDGVIGSIVMNCNPFTWGHRYLIEQALGMVDHLIIFVVEEDRSIFTFKERYAMVREGTRDLENVTVVPSGNFILSQTTFPEYFVKIEDEDLTDHVEYDITLFAEAIAPKLHITYRFVGEEREDRVTDAYNRAMKKILPEHGIRLVEIPRKTVADGNDTAISASMVRSRLEHEPPEELSDLIPDSTRRILEASWE